MRILHLIDSGGFYGAERVLLALAKHCVSVGDEVIVGTIVSPEDGNDPLGEAVLKAGLELHQFIMPDGFAVTGLRQIVEFVRRRSVDVVHTHGYRANIMLGVLPRQLRPCPIICTLHGWTATRTLQRIAAYEFLERLVVRRFDRIVAVSEQIERRLSRFVPPRQLAVIANGVAVNIGRECNGVESEGGGIPLLLAAGRLSEEKGFDLLVKAVERLRDEGVFVRLIIAGDGPMRESIHHAVTAASLHDRIELVGYQDSLDAFLGQASLFVLPSRSEGLPLVLLEAIARGVPVVATPVGEVPAVLDQGRLGIIATRVSSDALAEALERAITGLDDLRAVTEAARERVVRSYSVERMGERYRQEYLYAMQHPTS